MVNKQSTDPKDQLLQRALAVLRAERQILLTSYALRDSQGQYDPTTLASEEARQFRCYSLLIGDIEKELNQQGAQ